MKTLKQVFSEAADLIEKNGWCRGDFVRNGQYCILGACNKVTTGDPDQLDDRPEDSIAGALRQFLGVGAIIWNDTYASGQTEVVAKLRAIAEKVG